MLTDAACQNSIRALRIGSDSSAARTVSESTYPLPTLVGTGAPVLVEYTNVADT